MPYHGGRAITLEGFEQIPDDPEGYRIELSRGLVVREPPPGAGHGDVCSRLVIALGGYVRANGLGRTVIEAGFLLSTDPPTVRQPDIAFVRASRVPADRPPAYWPFAPDLAIEVVSPSNTLSELQQKVIDYFEAGTVEVWLIDPHTRAATIYHGLSDIAVLREPERLDGGSIVSGFSMPLSEIFAW